MKKRIVILWTLFFLSFFDIKAQSISNEGTDFWAVFPTHDPSYNPNQTPRLANVRIYITSKSTSNVTVSCGTWSIGPLYIPANQAIPVDVPREYAYVDSRIGEANQVLSSRGIHVVVNEGAKVAVYEHIYAGSRSAASLILPREALGQKYYSMNYAQSFQRLPDLSKGFLVLVAADDNTNLLIHDVNGVTTPVYLAKAGDVYQYMPDSNEDLTGTFVEVDPNSADNCNKRFAAFSGSTSVSIICNGSKDPLFQQLYPTISWGKSYGVVPFSERGYLIRILAQEDNTQINVGGTSIMLNKGAFYDNPGVLTGPVYISADKKISVAQYSITQDCSSANGAGALGDPEMVMLNPIEFNIKNVTLFSSPLENIQERYINVFMKTSAAPSFTINGTVPNNGTWQVVPANPEYSYIQINIFDVNSTLAADDGFNAIAYGYGAHESYAYSAGTNLAASTYFLVSNKITQNDAQNACVGQESDFKIILPYQVEQITWKLDDDPEENGTIVPRIITAPDGTLSYEYIYAKGIVFDQQEQHTVVIAVKRANDSSNCLREEVELTYAFNVYPIPTPDFTFELEGCADTDILFTDKSDSNLPGITLNKWRWDFGDGSPISTSQHPRHAFSASGIYTVRLSVGLDEGCMSDVKEYQITIKQKITPRFDAISIGCINKPINFRDQSFAESGVNIVKWFWDYGDGTPIDPNGSNQHPNHTYTRAGTYDVKLTVETDNGCRSLVFTRTVNIINLPQAVFNLPEICETDQMAVFVNNSLDMDGNETGLSYTWNFGDGNSSLNSSTDKEGSHRYLLAGEYPVTLTVTNANGCSNSLTKMFIVNGKQIIPSFNIDNSNNLCGSQKVKFKNTSAVLPVGQITKLRWYFDFVNNPGVFVEDEDPVFGKEYEFLYPPAPDVHSRQFTVRLEAYSGQVCMEVKDELITVYTPPRVVFNDLADLCVNSGKIQLTQASEAINIPGTGVYTGRGVAVNGSFDPQEAGVGVHQITYTFTADQGGCRDSQVRMITVTPIPELIIDRDIYILAGGERKIEASATGLGLTYRWSPATGLSRTDVLNPVIMGDSDMQYTLAISSSQGCTIIENIRIHVLKALYAPNAFSPNGDGINDTWVLKYIDTYPKATVDIFNRNGEKVFSSIGYENPFNGNYRNEPLPVGTYYYIINPKNGQKNITGSLTLIR